jgi:AcrR family transcriptional regulator
MGPVTPKRPVGRPPLLPDSVREALVLSTATRLFAQNGFHGTTMGAIAADSGVRKPNLYRQFSSKDEAFVAVVQQECRRLEEFLFRAYADSAGLPVEEMAHRCVGAIFEFADQHPDAFRLIFAADAAASEEASEVVGHAIRRVTEKVTQILRREFEQRGLPADTAVAALAEAIIGMCEFSARRAQEEGWDTAATAQLMGSLLYRGLAGLRPSVLESFETSASMRSRVPKRASPRRAHGTKVRSQTN